MTIEINDIEIFIPTHNRSFYLVQAIQSLLTQTAGIKSITVLDNDSIDDTEEVVNSFNDIGVKYVKTSGFLGNFNKAQELASKKYVMLFHDDDLLHPKYLEMALKALNKYDDISLIATRSTGFSDENIPNYSENLNEEHYLFKSQQDFAKHMYFIENIAYASAIYRTEDFKKESLEYEKFSKFNDWPFIIKMAAHGSSILFNDFNVSFSRVHAQQDSVTSENYPSFEQIVNWDKFFYDIIQPQKKENEMFYIPFRCKSVFFMGGKYKLHVPDEYKKSHSIQELWDISRTVDLDPYQRPKVPEELENEYVKALQVYLYMKDKVAVL